MMKRVILSMLGIVALCSATLLLACNDDPVRPDLLGPWEETTSHRGPGEGLRPRAGVLGDPGPGGGSGRGGNDPRSDLHPVSCFAQGRRHLGSRPGSRPSRRGTALRRRRCGRRRGGDCRCGPDGGWGIHPRRTGRLEPSRIRLRRNRVRGERRHASVRRRGNREPAGDGEHRRRRVDPGTLPFPANRNERGLEGIATRNGLWAACGFDDGAEGTPESPSGCCSCIADRAGTGSTSPAAAAPTGSSARWR